MVENLPYAVLTVTNTTDEPRLRPQLLAGSALFSFEHAPLNAMATLTGQCAGELQCGDRAISGRA